MLAWLHKRLLPSFRQPVEKEYVGTQGFCGEKRTPIERMLVDQGSMVISPKRKQELIGACFSDWFP